MRAVVSLLLCVVLTVSVSPSATVAQGSAIVVLDLAMGSGGVVALAPEGTGWAVVRIKALDDLQLHFTVTHEAMQDLCLFTEDGDGIYDRGHATGFFLTGSDNSSQSFTWHGVPGWSVWPQQTGDCGVSENVTVHAGQTATLVVADTVGGYAIVLGANHAVSDAPGPSVVSFALGHHEDFLRADLEPETRTTLSASGLEVQRERTWSTELAVTDAMVVVADYDLRRGSGELAQSVHAGILWDVHEVLSDGEQTTMPYTTQPEPGWTVAGSNGTHFTRSAPSFYPTDAGNLTARYVRVDTSLDVGIDVTTGAYVISFPMSG